ncbi:MAG: ABC transporter permease [Bacteroidaceae bacterium]|nr:ABC transporter permease [Bacteroidaceae bacterium]
MITHHLKVAFRNLFKYKTQSAISLLGLAVGFTCFALSAIWIHYEMTYDTFHEDAGQIHIIRKKDDMSLSQDGVNNYTPYVLAQYLKDNFSEVKAACAVQGGNRGHNYFFNDEPYHMQELSLDSMAFSVFDIRILEGSNEFLTLRSNKVAITRRAAHRMFGNEDPIGKEIYDSYNRNKPLNICAVVSEWPGHSNFEYDIITRVWPNDRWRSSGWQTLVRLHKNASSEAFVEKIAELVVDVPGSDNWQLKDWIATPITQLHYDHPIIGTDIKFQHVVLFSIASALVILCCLLNYIGLFVTQIRNRSKEFALRMVNGASSFRLFQMLMTEYALLLFAAWFFSMMFIELLLPYFREVSEIKLSQMEVYQQATLCTVAMILLSALMASIPILYYRKRSTQSILSTQKGGREKNLFRRATLLFQLVISIGFIFCALVIMKQLHFLNHSDVGMERKNRAALMIHAKTDKQMLQERIKQLAEVEEVIGASSPLIPTLGLMSRNYSTWEDKPEGAEGISIEIILESAPYMNFYGFTLVEGEMIQPSSSETDIVLNEAAVKALGWHKAVGKDLGRGKVIGVVKDWHITSPTMPIRPTAFQLSNQFAYEGSTSILIRYKQDTWKSCREKVEAIVKETYPNARMELTNTEEEYNKFLTSENALLRMLTILSLVCILISVFGIYSQIVLTCEQRRKEIAIRKVNGAHMKDILSMFAKEYATLLAIASVIAFSIGYAIMKHWLESYTLQTPVSWWIFASIFVGIAIVVAISIGYRVWKAANENPAEVVKSE